jgi:hypothetical protein
MVERQLPKLHTRVRFPSPAPAHFIHSNQEYTEEIRVTFLI